MQNAASKLLLSFQLMTYLTRPIDHSRQVNMTISQRNLGNVLAPDIVTALDLKTSKKMRILFVPVARNVPSAATFLHLSLFSWVALLYF